MPITHIRVLANKDGGDVKAIYQLHSSQFGFFECDHMPSGLCNVPATFQRLIKIVLAS